MPSTNENLGRLERVVLRAAWASEANDFTPWLAQSENIRLLGDTIGIDLEVEGQEKNVGPFRADILCKDTADGNWVLIENQLERTDHTHLGQLITYAAGLHAVTIVWLSERFTDEHRAALDWLNEMTEESINFFGLEIELWRIGNSPIAPKFNVVSSPNDWTKHVNQVKNSQDLPLTPAKVLQIEFWSTFREWVQSRGATFKTTKPLPQHWMNIAIGRAGILLNAIASLSGAEIESDNKHEIRAELALIDENSKNFYAQLLAQKGAIEDELNEPLTWYNPENKRVCRMSLRRGADLYDKTQWPKYHEWLRVKLEALQKVFGPRVKRLEANSPEELDDSQNWSVVAAQDNGLSRPS